MHDILQLPKSHAQNDNRPTELVQLKFDVTDLHGGNRQDKNRRIPNKGNRFRVFRVGDQVVEVGIGLDHLADEIPVGVEDGDGKPGPLGRTKEGDRVLDLFKVGVVSDLDELTKE